MELREWKYEKRYNYNMFFSVVYLIYRSWKR